MPEKEHQDPRFRKYVQLIERNLQSFDAVNEWADIISFLGRLLKSFQAYPQFQVIPHKQIVSKRLAQCLNPGFPAGVHQKTLEVYAYILETIGRQQLAEDLPLWSVGLFPFIQYAATHVKPQLLTLFEKYYYPLGVKLRPAMRGFIIALLPALEEEGSEGFDKVVTMLDRLSNIVELPFFYSCIWLIMINNNNLRLATLNYLLRRLPKIVNTEDVALVLGGPENIGLMVRAFSTTLMDQQLLVQRGMLELLVQNYVLQHRTLRHDDLVILTRSALSIVLRKDMSLNRRLYAWLLGQDTTSQSQLQYFHRYAEKPATQAIKSLFFTTSYDKHMVEDDMGIYNKDVSSVVTDAQKPYKILISLLDKWEIGQPIVNNIFIDSLISLQGYDEHGSVEQEILQTANMWMEMIEPYLIWGKLFNIIDISFPPLSKASSSKFGQPSRKTGLKLVEFTLGSFKFTDEEIKHMHLPLVLESIRHVSFTGILNHVIQCIDIILIILKQLPDSVFMDRQRKLSTPVGENSSLSITSPDYQKEFKTGMDALEYARDFYGIKQRIGDTKQHSIKDGDSDNTATSTTSMVSSNNKSTTMENEEQEDEGDLTSQRTSTITLDDETIAAVTKPSYGPIRGSTLMNEITRNLVRFLAELVNNYVVAPENNMNTNGHQVKQILNKLWIFLGPSTQLLHMRTVELLWLLTDTSVAHHVEAIMASYLIIKDDQERMVNYEKFGIFWELSENMVEVSTLFSRPMFLMLDLLRDDTSPVNRRAAETWIRCHLKSYARLLEPFITTLLNRYIIRRSTEKRIPYVYQSVFPPQQQDDIYFTVPYFLYMRSFDMDIVDYMLTTLTTLIQFGGVGVLKACSNYTIGDAGLMPLLIESGLDHPNLNFLELLVHIAIRFLESEPCDKLYSKIIKPVRQIQLHASDLLYLIISKLDYVDMTITSLIQKSVLQKLLFCISSGDLDIQPKLLHLLHATMSITAADNMSPSPLSNASSMSSLSSPSQQQRRRRESISTTYQVQQEALKLARSTANLYVKCVLDAFHTANNRPLLLQWMDFVLVTLPHVRQGFRQVVVPILICLCQQVNLCNVTVRLLMHGDNTDNVQVDDGTHVNGLNWKYLNDMDEKVTDDDESSDGRNDASTTKPLIQERSAIIATGTINETMDSSSNISDKSKPRNALLYHLPIILHILLDVWRVFRQPTWDQSTVDVIGFAKKDAVLQSFAYAADHVKARLETTFEILYKHCPVEVIEGFVELFFMENPIALEYEVILTCIPTNTPQQTMTILLDSIRQRTPGIPPSHRKRPISRIGKLTDTSLLRFAEIYCQEMVRPEIACTLWPSIYTFAKEYLSQASAYKMFLPGLLRFLTVALDGFIRFSEDKKARKDAQDLYQRCVDYCILIAGRSFDQGLWLRGLGTELFFDTGTGFIHDGGVPRNLSTSTVSDLEKKASWKSREDFLIIQLNHYLAIHVIPQLRQLMGDQDRINSLLNNLVYYVIGPHLRSRTTIGLLHGGAVIVDQVVEMAKMPFTYKTWRKEVWDVFNEGRFFYMTRTTAKKWCKILATMFSLEKDRFMELMGKITTSATVNNSAFFTTNKDQETWQRALHLRRVSFVIFAGTMDQFVPQLPSLQEKIVDLLKLDHSEMVHVEIYLCLRILLLRFSQKHLINFWPVLISELMRLFNAVLANASHDRPEEAQIALGGCKFLDLLCTLELDSFQVYQWIFIRDTVEALIQREQQPKTTDMTPTMMDQLEDKIEDISRTTNNNAKTMLMEQEGVTTMKTQHTTTLPSSGELKRPMLTMHNIGSILQLDFFIHHISLYVYQSSYMLAKPDLYFIESLLLQDLLDGDMRTE
ncbi:Dopey, N-terminal-domain-containing protein [Halteromyces radiatus]|uniref:Dopey, N-terminal-domain-containing protein n=1 Tax=Halteromyces radiatus TaxID=101107 RepID=UPI00221FDADF|nr:Dopey, N-terminal-domain-containing protein [Halteromyces radiatus]KAI8082733.1 Dopey, N-terminal-domain-containing protein [Halteromyces radiatus]